MRWLLPLSVALLASGLPPSATPSPAAGISYDRDVRPILAENCFACHGPAEERGGDLRLDVREEAVADRGGYAAIVPGDPVGSEILRRILSTDPDEVMPPPRAKKHRLSDQQLATLRTWIADGAEYETHWAFRPLASVEPPPADGRSRNAIDAFIAARLAAEGLAPSPEAPQDVLLRRVSLDLVGLQPSPEELQAFLTDPAEDAYERAVDRLLASPHYGERWARHWLDQARYADSHGHTFDEARAMWPWRDWVIAAINADMPFDRFTVEQLAGDLLPGSTKLQRVATGFHRNTMINQEGGVKPELARNEIVVDRVNTTGAVWLGLTVGCAQCHTHKYDPLTQKEYFQLFAFFNGDADVNDLADGEDVFRGEIIGRSTIDARAIADADGLVDKARAGSGNRLATWLESWPADEAVPANEWTTIRPRPSPAMIGNAPIATLEPDGSTLALVGNESATVEFTVAGFTAPIRALRFEFPVDTASGARSHAADGRIFISDISLSAAAGDPLPIMATLATAETTEYAAVNVIDGLPGTGWTAAAEDGGEPAIVVVPRAVISPDETLVVKVRFTGGDRRLPRRLRVTSTTQKSLAPLAPHARRLLGRAIASRHGGGGEPPAEKDVREAFASVDLGLHESLVDRAALRRRAMIGRTLVMRALPTPRETFLQVRGDPQNPDIKLGPLPADTPAFLPRLVVEQGRRPTRLDLARWLVRPDNPLTPRVTVNRAWMRFFGIGLVETENDFGLQGSLPTHPELLDWLAARFVHDGWSMKRLHRLIVTSATYRQASTHRADLATRDPRNLLLGRQNRVRLDAEVIRDTALVAAGLLVRDVGGPSVHPPQPDGVYAFTQTTKPWPTATGSERHRRTLYTQFYRSAPHPLFTTFDTPNFTQACTRRIPSNTPLQSLMLANDPIFMEASAAIGDRVAAMPAAADADPVAARIDRLFTACLARHPSAAERSLAATFLASQDADAEGPSSGWRALARGIVNTDNFVVRE